MVRCPRCGSNIDHLNYEEKVLETGFFMVLEGEPMYDSDEMVDIEGPIFKCPKCKETLFEDEKQAMKFLEEA